VQAIACLLDNRVAEKAYEVIFKCRRRALEESTDAKLRHIAITVPILEGCRFYMQAFGLKKSARRLGERARVYLSDA